MKMLLKINKKPSLGLIIGQPVIAPQQTSLCALPVCIPLLLLELLGLLRQSFLFFWLELCLALPRFTGMVVPYAV